MMNTETLLYEGPGGHKTNGTLKWHGYSGISFSELEIKGMWRMSWTWAKNPE
jgi:hypothetical protein